MFLHLLNQGFHNVETVAHPAGKIQMKAMSSIRWVYHGILANYVQQLGHFFHHYSDLIERWSVLRYLRPTSLAYLDDVNVSRCFIQHGAESFRTGWTLLHDSIVDAYLKEVPCQHYHRASNDPRNSEASYVRQCSHRRTWHTVGNAG